MIQNNKERCTKYFKSYSYIIKKHNYNDYKFDLLKIKNLMIK